MVQKGEHVLARIAIDRAVREGLGVERGQSIVDVALRIARSAVPSPALHAARVILNEKKRPDVWERMERAARVLGWTGDVPAMPGRSNVGAIRLLEAWEQEP